MTVIKTQDELYDDNVTMSDLVETWNALNPAKPVTRFSSIDVGRSRCSNAILAAKDITGHAGVPKGSAPTVDLDKIAAASAAPAPAAAEAAPAPNPEGAAVPTKKTPAPKKTAKAPAAPAKKAPAEAKKAAKAPTAAKKAAKAPAPAKKATAGAKKAAPAKSGKRAVYERVRLTEPDTPRRPQETSQRFKVLAALRRRKQCTVDQLSDDVGFNARAFVHKLAAVGWCEVIAAEEEGK